MVLVTVKFLLITQEWNRDTFYYCKYYCLSLFDLLWQNIIGLVAYKNRSKFLTVTETGKPKITVPEDSVSSRSSFLVHRWLSSCRIFKDRRMREVSGVYFIRVLTSFLRTPRLWICHFLKSPMHKIHHWGLGFNMNMGKNIQSTSIINFSKMFLEIVKE